jgi:RNA polymerase sigma-70 factor (ECF subfamily)
LTATSHDIDPTGEMARPSESLDFDKAYSGYFVFACRSLRLLGVEPDSLEDAAQEVFAIVLRRLAEFDARGSLKAWIFAIVQRVAANHRRSRRRKRDHLEPLGDSHAATDVDPDARVDAARAARLIQAFAEELDEPRRVVLVLGVLERMPARELADSLGVPLFTAYSRVRSIRESLKAFLDRHEVGR